MNSIFVIVSFALAIQYSQLATVPNTEIYNCETGKSGDRIATCGMCLDGRIPSADRVKCFKCPEYCSIGKCKLKADVSNENDATYCEGCIDRYYLKESKCYECPTGCRNCTSDRECLDCYSNYVMKDTSKECVTCPSNCIQCSWSSSISSAICDVCDNRYINKDTGCTSCLAYCKICSYDKNRGISCSSCDNNAYKVTNDNINTCKLCSSSISGCNKCSDKDTCTECKSKAYALTTLNKCEKCSSIHSACIECDARSSINICTKCTTGYYLKDGSCSACSRNCDSCTETNDLIKCTKCTSYYTKVELKVCDRCLDNCLECELSSSKTLVCKAGRCESKYALNSDGVCIKCPDNCNACTWVSEQSRTECIGSSVSHSCVENEGGQSWTRKSDGKCIACPDNCLKCYFVSSLASLPICYASKCAQGFAYDDESGNCFACPSGCDYCKKRSTGYTCLKCKANYAPKYKSGSTVIIESCMPCSIANCDYCEVIGSNVQCLRSPCASKRNSAANKKFSFTTQTCSTACPVDTLCDEYMQNDENEACFCRSCAGGAVIQAGANAGLCKSCGVDCSDCGLNSDKTDVLCKTCTGTKIWIAINIGDVPTPGCYDCASATPHCKTYEYSSGTCKCKSGGCIGDQTSTGRPTVLQSTTGTQGCSPCSTEFPNAIWCSGALDGPNPKAIDTCKNGYIKSGTVPNSCLVIGSKCTDWSSTPAATTTDATCLKCAPGTFLDTDKCTLCPVACKECISASKCTSCVATNSGVPASAALNCIGDSSGCPADPDCATPWVITAPSTCQCIKCDTGKVFDPANTPNEEGVIATCTPKNSDALTPNCIIAKKGAGTANDCTKCDSGYVLTGATCTAEVTNCKSGYSFDNAGVANCKVTVVNAVLKSDFRSAEIVPTANQGGPNCIGYITNGSPTFSGATGRCTGCSNGFTLDTSVATNYQCIDCTSTTLANCALIIGLNGNCKCGKCIANTASVLYFMKLDHSGCMAVNTIPGCSADKHTLRLKSSSYIVVCKQCDAGKQASADAQSCLDCTQTCNGGTIAVKEGKSTCECTCDRNANKFLNTAGDSCILCSTTQIANCAEFDYDGTNCKCTKCMDNFQLKSDKSACINCQATTAGAVANCKVCEVIGSLTVSVSKCKECIAGYILNSAGNCIQCPVSPLTCSECRIDPADITRTLCLSFGCSSYALNDADFTCVYCGKTNCAICVRDVNNNDICLKCENGYYMDDKGNCEPCVAGCSFCLNGDSCLPNGCKIGYIQHRTDGSCTPCIGTGVSRCVYETAVSDVLVPKICIEGYTLNTAITPITCEKCDVNCKKCDINKKGKCDSQSCKDGYFYDSVEQICYKNKDNCITSLRSNGKTICNSCNTATVLLSSGECIACPPGCRECNFDETLQNYVCISCNAQFYKTSDGLCKACPTGCSVCSLNGANVECSNCLATYGLKGTSCELCGIGQCQTCSVQSGGSGLICLTCSNKFYLNSDDCGKCPNFCMECSHNGTYQCSKCYAGYGIAPDGSCVRCPLNCEMCKVNQDKTTVCINCSSNAFSLKADGTCVKCSEAAFTNCATCGATPSGGKANCISCETGYSLQDNNLACVPCSIIGCGLCSHGRICSKCKSGFYLHNYNRECARKCYECRGNQEDCGNDVSDIKNVTDKVKIIDCEDVPMKLVPRQMRMKIAKQ
ncbi:DgyrCDS837 [Dimorphilus gyrociliatus]|uniref:DgyrCDS837 n=1 Tax=Dimorphilus gyrociliatus TaxID=2664684 RepID=A0A7I8V5U2_9ANNE|nr:DgyrCDS837 [Dimorphilus gyrociliatus]